MPATSSGRLGHRPSSVLQDLWRQRLQRFERCGLSAVAFCAKRASLPPPSMPGAAACASRPLRGPPAAHPPDADARLVPVRLLPAAAPVELLLRGGGVLRLAPGCDLDFVRLVVATLGDLPC